MARQTKSSQRSTPRASIGLSPGKICANTAKVRRTDIPVFALGFLNPIAHIAGVYFALDACYSAYPKYSAPDDENVQRIFVVDVLVGEYCVGKVDAVQPDERPDKENELFDSTVDNLDDPSLFVTFNDAQACK